MSMPELELTFNYAEIVLHLSSGCDYNKIGELGRTLKTIVEYREYCNLTANCNNMQVIIDICEAYQGLNDLANAKKIKDHLRHEFIYKLDDKLKTLLESYK